MRKSLVFCSLLLAACGGKHGGSGSGSPENKGGEASAPAGMDVETTVQGAPEAGKPVNADRVELKFGLSDEDLAKLGLALDYYECKFSESAVTWVKCMVPFVYEGLENGREYSVTVRARLKKIDTQEIVYAKEVTSTWKVDRSAPQTGDSGNGNSGNSGDSGDQGNGGIRIGGLASQLQVGSAYQIKVADGLHVTEYSTSKTTGVLSFFRIMNDPYYLGNFGCENSYDRQFAQRSASGETMLYCHSTPTRDQYKGEHEFRLANNHVEVATDTALVTKESQERLTFSIFDEDYEFMTRRSRFKNVCQNSPRNYIDVPMIPNFFLGKNPETVRFWYCDTYLSDVDGSASLWRVGAFYDIDHMDWDCNDCKYDRAIESVYMVRANAGVFTPYQFAKTAQVRILDLLTKITP